MVYGEGSKALKREYRKGQGCDLKVERNKVNQTNTFLIISTIVVAAVPPAAALLLLLLPLLLILLS